MDYRNLELEISRFIQRPEAHLTGLYSVFAGKNTDLITLAGALLQEYFDNLSPKEMDRLGEQMQNRSSINWYADWKEVDHALLSRYLSKEQLFCVAAVGTYHPNGYYRWTCMETLAAYGDRSTPFFLPRLNDWVPEIRQYAQQLLRTRLKTCTTESLLSCIRFLERLKAGSRRTEADYNELYKLYTQRLLACREEISPRWLLSLSAHDRHQMYQLASEIGLLTDSDWRLLLKQERDSYSKICILRAMQKQGSLVLNFDSELVCSKDATVRYFILQALYESHPELWQNYEAYLTDPKRTIRELARFVIRQHTDFDFPAYYRAELARSPCEGAVYGLGETGSRENAQLLKALLQSDVFRIRRAALKSLSLVLGPDGEQIYLQYFFESSGLSKTAYLILRSLRIITERDMLFSMASSAKGAIFQRRFLVLINKMSYWDKLIYLLELYRTCEGEMKLRVNASIQFLLFYSGEGYAYYSKSQARQIKESYNKVKSDLPEKTQELLAFALRTYRF